MSAYRQPYYYGSQIGASLSVLALSAILQRNAPPSKPCGSSHCRLNVLRGHRVNVVHKGGAGFPFILSSPLCPPLLYSNPFESSSSRGHKCNSRYNSANETSRISRRCSSFLPNLSLFVSLSLYVYIYLSLFPSSSRFSSSLFPLQTGVNHYATPFSPGRRMRRKRRIGETRTDIRFLFEDGRFAPPFSRYPRVPRCAAK